MIPNRRKGTLNKIARNVAEYNIKHPDAKVSVGFYPIEEYDYLVNKINEIKCSLRKAA